MEARNADIRRFNGEAHQIVEWMTNYLLNLRTLPVKSTSKFGDIKNQLPLSPPRNPEPFTEIFNDFKNIIIPGITHWQHPGFLAYFPVGSSEASILAEMLITTIAAQCMVWYTSPAAEELEERTVEWLQEMIGLSKDFVGCLQDTSSSSTLLALLTARERRTGWRVNREGFAGVRERFRVYTSDQAHSSVEKGAKIAGLGADNVVKVPVDEKFSMDPAALEQAIQADLQRGYTPLIVVSTIGTTSSTAIDPIPRINTIAKKYNLWHHIDASYAGTAMILPEYRYIADGVNDVDSFVFNPHKWFFVNFDCSVYYVKSKRDLLETFSILPEYLKTPEDKMANNYRDWGIPLGRKFRGLKLWFVMRYYGVEGLQRKIREHVEWGRWVRREMEETEGFEILAPVEFNLICFRFRPKGVVEEGRVEEVNVEILRRVNESGRVMMTHTRLNGKFCIRFVGGNINMVFEDIKFAWELLKGICLAQQAKL